MTSRARSLIHLAAAGYFAAVLLLAARVDAPCAGAVAAAGMGAALYLSVSAWRQAERERRP